MLKYETANRYRIYTSMHYRVYYIYATKYRRSGQTWAASLTFSKRVEIFVIFFSLDMWLLCTLL